MHAPAFPQYFPVFDYGAAADSSHGATAMQADEPGSSQQHYVQSHPGVNGIVYASTSQVMNGQIGAFPETDARGNRLSPEESMQHAWYDIVAQIDNGGEYSGELFSRRNNGYFN